MKLQNVFDGWGILLILYSEKYIGEFKNGKYDGMGRLITLNKVYEGNWNQGKLNGQATEWDVIRNDET